jgi:hypothetical protein
LGLTRDAGALLAWQKMANALEGPHARHAGCLGSTDEDAAASFPRRALVPVMDAPLTSPEFADALRAFCKDVVAAP